MDCINCGEPFNCGITKSSNVSFDFFTPDEPVFKEKVLITTIKCPWCGYKNVIDATPNKS